MLMCYNCIINVYNVFIYLIYKHIADIPGVLIHFHIP